MTNKYYVRHIRINTCSYSRINTNKLYLYLTNENKYYSETKYEYNIQLLSTPFNYNIVKNEDVTENMNLYKFVEYFNEEFPIKVSLNELIELTKKNNKLHCELEKMDNTLYGDNYYDTELNAYNNCIIIPNNKYEYFTLHKSYGTYGDYTKHNIVIGLYTYDELTNKYTFVKHSMYNKLNNMYYVCELYN